ncbi:MAG TPA: flavodoxin family protein [Mycobacterium sp.]|nr:flavodoxin family protein [Mycobacterium sp.]
MTDAASEQRPRVLLLYYTYMGQALKVLEAAGEVFRGRGCDVQKAEIEFTGRRFAERFSRFPIRRVWLDMLSVLPAQTRRPSREIRTPDAVRNRELRPDLHRLPDLVANHEHVAALLPQVGRGTKTAGRQASRRVRCLPPLLAGELHGGAQAGGEAGRSVRRRSPFAYPGDQLRSMLSLISCLGTGAYQGRYPVPGRAHPDDQRPATPRHETPQLP